jgi:hypothetical protein
MNYLKKFEDIDFDTLVKQMKAELNKYWKIEMIYFKESIYKLSNICNFETTDEYINKFEHNVKNNFAYLSDTKFIYITYHHNDDFFGWNDTENFLIQNDYTNMGKIEITSDDIKRYKIWTKSKKYNL